MGSCAGRGQKLVNDHEDKGNSYFAKNEFYLALKSFKAALELTENSKSSEKSNRRLYSKIARCYCSLGSPKEAVSYYKRSDTLAGEEDSASDLIQLAYLYNSIGSCRLMVGYYIESLEAFEKSGRTLGNITNIFPDKDIEIRNALGLGLQRLGKYPEALEIHMKTLNLLGQSQDIKKKQSIVFSNIASCLLRMEKFSEALEYYQKSLENRKADENDNAVDLGISYNNIGALYLKMDKLQEAIEMLNYANEIWEKSLPLKHSNFSKLFNNLGVYNVKLGNISEGAKYFEKSRVLIEEIFPNDHPKIALIYCSLAMCAKKEGNMQEALTYYTKSKKIGEEKLKEHPDMAIIYNNYASYLYSSGKTKEAKEMLDMSVNVRKSAFGYNSPVINANMIICVSSLE